MTRRELIEHLNDRRACEKVRVVNKHESHGAVAFTGVKREVELRPDMRPRFSVERLRTLAELGRRVGCCAAGERKALGDGRRQVQPLFVERQHVEEHLKKRCAAGIASRREVGQEQLERHVLMGERAERGFANATQELTE